MTQAESPTCDFCRGAIAGEVCRRQNLRTRAVVSFHPDCFEQVQAEIRRRKDDALRRIADRFEACWVGPDGFDAAVPNWPYARFENAAFRKLSSAVIVDALERWKPAEGSLILSARTGAGKTAGCVAKLCQLRAQAEKTFDPRRLPSFLFTTAAQLGAARRQQRLGTGESYLVDQAMHRDLLVLDEIGFEVVDGVAFEVIDERYRKQLPTLVTTGLKPADFAQRYGSAAWRRLTESGAVVEDHGRELKIAAR